MLFILLEYIFSHHSLIDAEFLKSKKGDYGLIYIYIILVMVDM